eukprot:8868614-Lingulodinium_polyedra.AAC.1
MALRAVMPVLRQARRHAQASEHCTRAVEVLAVREAASTCGRNHGPSARQDSCNVAPNGH